ncbi:FliI/YscN family ATPase [Buchnera aphidicola (Formosaphis micheliae)]|uniref:FliI/YscN family ATPase n=1 Tax=Buchnera aphidicola TaxID=9 RepID=UPI0031CC77E7
MNSRLKKWIKKLNDFEKKIHFFPENFIFGYVVGVNGSILEVSGLNVPIGSICFVETIIYGQVIEIDCEVISFKKNKLLLIMFEQTIGIQPYSRVFLKSYNKKMIHIGKPMPIGDQLLGRVIDNLGRPLDGLSRLNLEEYSFLQFKKINPLYRQPITEVLDTGIKSINALLTIGKGQRIGLFSSSGLGKSVLLGMIARYTKVDIIIVALIGERGREINDFINNILGKEGLSRSVIIAVPSNYSAISQVQGALYATYIAEYFRNKKYHVLLIMDSLTRYAMAHREIALSIGELPAIKGFPPSVFSKLSHLVEHAGNGLNDIGSMSAIYTVLTEINIDNDPISEVTRSFLDGHIVLSKLYADSGHYPAIDIETSISRLTTSLVNSTYYFKIRDFKRLISVYQSNKELINIGAYVAGNNLILDKAIKLWSKIENFLIQDINSSFNYIDSCQALLEILD